jgi:hypothetical protein
MLVVGRSGDAKLQADRDFVWVLNLALVGLKDFLPTVGVAVDGLGDLAQAVASLCDVNLDFLFWLSRSLCFILFSRHSEYLPFWYNVC